MSGFLKARAGISLATLQIELDYVSARFDFLEKIGIGVVARWKQFFGDFHFLVAAVEAFLLAFADHFLSIQLQLVLSGGDGSVKASAVDNGAFAGELAALFDEGDRAAGDGLAVKSYRAGDGRFAVAAAESKSGGRQSRSFP